MEVQTKHLADGKYAEPEQCPAQGCRSKKFTVDKQSVRAADWQKVRLQELSTAGPAPYTTLHYSTTTFSP